MTPFTALDEVLNAGLLTPASTRGVAAAPDFQPLFANALAPAAESRAVAAPACEPQVEMLQENGRVQQIVVTCKCGERTVIDCAY